MQHRIGPGCEKPLSMPEPCVGYVSDGSIMLRAPLFAKFFPFCIRLIHAHCIHYGLPILLKLCPLLIRKPGFAMRIDILIDVPAAEKVGCGRKKLGYTGSQGQIPVSDNDLRYDKGDFTVNALQYHHGKCESADDIL